MSDPTMMFRRAAEPIDRGDVEALRALVDEHPDVVTNEYPNVEPWGDRPAPVPT